MKHEKGTYCNTVASTCTQIIKSIAHTLLFWPVCIRYLFHVYNMPLSSNSNLLLVNLHRELNIDDANQSLRIVKNLIEAGSYQSCAAIDDIICMFLECTSVIIKTKISDAYSFAVKVRWFLNFSKIE